MARKNAAPPDDEVIVEAPEGEHKPLTAHDQFERNMKIIAEHARGDSWPVVAERHGLKVRRCQQIAAEYRDRHKTLRHSDPLEVVDDLLEGYRADLADATEVFRTSKSGSSKIGALNTRMNARAKQAELLQAIGVLPNDLGSLKIEIDAQVTIDALFTVLDNHNVLTPELEDQMLKALGGPTADTINGTATEA